MVSTPIGPSSSEPSTEDENIVQNATSDIQMLSLITSTPDFLARLPSFRAQSSSSVSSPGTQSPQIFTPAVPNIEPSSVQHQYTPSTSPERAYSPSDSAMFPAHVAQTVDVNTFPFLVQRSSSVCEVSTPSIWKSNIAPEMRTESFPTLSQGLSSSEVSREETLCSLKASDTSKTVKYSYPIKDTSPAITPPTELNSNDPSSVRSPVSSFLDTQLATVSALSETGPQSPVKLSFPVYSGFAQLGSDSSGSVEENNAKEFFYQNWYVK